jgi:CubicO group peptidase (beta-lactamase class C family)
VEWAKGYGLADVAGQRPVDAQTLFLAGSISKPVTALRTLQLVEDGTFALDANINTYLTSRQLPDNEFTTIEKVTLRRILNHTAGLTVWGFPGYDKGDAIPSVPEVLEGNGNTDPVRVFKTPGESWLYSGGGYTIMQLAMTDTLGAPFPDTMRTNILEPLGMQSSTFENPLPEALHPLAATGYRADGREVEGKWPIYPEMAAAGLWTTPTDLIQYAIHLQDILKNKKDGVLAYSTVIEMLTPGQNGHGLGPVVNDDTFGHSGADEGFRALLFAWRNSPHALVMMVNSDNGAIFNEVMMALTEEYGLPGFDPLIKTRVTLADDQLTRMQGTYEVPGAGPLTISLEDGRLMISAAFIPDTVELVPESEITFFNHDSGRPYEFIITDGAVTGFSSGGTISQKID